MTSEQIKAVGAQIRDETITGANTAARVGGVIVGIGEKLEELDEVKTDFNTLSSIILGAKNTVRTSSGVEFSNILDIDIPTGSQFTLTVEGPDNVILDNKLNVSAWEDNGSGELVLHNTFVTGGISFPYSNTFTAAYHIKRLRIQRSSSGVVGIGNVTMKILSEEGLYYVKEQVDTMVEELSDVDAGISERIDSIDDLLEGEGNALQTKNTQVGENYVNNVNVEIPAGTDFTVEVYGDSGILSNDGAINVKFYEPNGTSHNMLEGTTRYPITLTNNRPYDIAHVSVERLSSGVLSVGSITLSVTSGTGGAFYRKSQIDEMIADTFYVSPDGLDTNDGKTAVHPLLNVNTALSKGAKTIFVASGVYNQQINFSFAKRRDILIQCTDAHGLSLFKPAKANYVLAESESAVSGYTKVYKIASSIFATGYTAIYQEGVNDATTLIDGLERLPMQRGKEYRCENTLIKKCSSESLSQALTEIEGADEFLFFYDSTNKIIYYSRPQAVTSSKPLVFGKNAITLFSGITKDLRLTVIGITSWYMSFNLQGIGSADIVDCCAKYMHADGAFMWYDGSAISFTRCEAARCHSDNYGDGFNGHANKTGDAFAKTCVAQLIDCWSHDNHDDGFSDHERAESVVRGGLYEYNGKGGIVPAYGSHCSCYGVYSRRNYCGFYHIGNTPVDEGGKYGQMLCIACVAENNTRGGNQVGFLVDGQYSRAVLINCKSIGNGIGYKAGSQSSMVLIDCGAKDNTTVSSGTMTKKNTTIV